MKKKTAKSLILSFAAAALFSCTSVNSVQDEHFDSDGYCLDSVGKTFHMVDPLEVKFFVEVSGSMNGFFRQNQPTDFKEDLWRILKYYSPISRGVTILTNEGDQGKQYDMDSFKSNMNTGAFVSTASTKVPTMLESIFAGLDARRGEVAVLVSDMKYSPVGDKAPDVLMRQYSTDVASILGKYDLAVSLIGAKSNCYDKKGNVQCLESPYYYVILGTDSVVAKMRNGISTFLENEGRLVDNIDSGMDFGAPSASFGKTFACEQLLDEPTFVNYEEADELDTCTIEMKVSLENYRWIIVDSELFKESFKIVPLYGSKVKIDEISMDVKNISSNKQLERTATANVKIKVFDMPLDADVLEWSLKLPDLDITNFYPYFDNAFDENDPTKSFSVKSFVEGMFYGGVVNKDPMKKYILISKHQ